MFSYLEFLKEGSKAKDISGRVMTTNTSQHSSINYADETIEGLRKRLLDVYFKKTEDKESREIINKCISTYVYCLDKKLKISSDIIEKLAKAINVDVSDVTKKLTDETKNYYEKDKPNHFGTTS